MEPLTPEIVRQWLADVPQLANDRSCKVRGLINTLTWIATDWLEKEAQMQAWLEMHGTPVASPAETKEKA